MGVRSVREADFRASEGRHLPLHEVEVGRLERRKQARRTQELAFTLDHFHPDHQIKLSSALLMSLQKTPIFNPRSKRCIISKTEEEEEIKFGAKQQRSNNVDESIDRPIYFTYISV